MYKINRFHIYIVLISALFLQVTVLNFLAIFGVKPDLVLISVIFFGLFLGPGAGLEFGLVAGLLKDIFALDYFGINAFIFCLTGLIVGVVNTRFFKESRMTQFVLVFSFTIFSMVLHYFLVYIFSRSLNINLADYLIISVLPASIYTSLVAIPIFSRFISMYNLKEQEELL